MCLADFPFAFSTQDILLFGPHHSRVLNGEVRDIVLDVGQKGLAHDDDDVRHSCFGAFNSLRQQLICTEATFLFLQLGHLLQACRVHLATITTYYYHVPCGIRIFASL